MTFWTFDMKLGLSFISAAVILGLVFLSISTEIINMYRYVFIIAVIACMSGLLGLMFLLRDIYTIRLEEIS